MEGRTAQIIMLSWAVIVVLSCIGVAAVVRSKRQRMRKTTDLDTMLEQVRLDTLNDNVNDMTVQEINVLLQQRFDNNEISKDTYEYIGRHVLFLEYPHQHEDEHLKEDLDQH